MALSERARPAATPESETRNPRAPHRRIPVRVALVGAGYVAQFHRDILSEMPEV